MNVTIELVKNLRDQTNSGLGDCRKALVDCEGDMDRALDLLKQRGLADVATRAGAEAREGVIAIGKHPYSHWATMFEVNSQTDFVARNPEFQHMIELMVSYTSEVDSFPVDLFGQHEGLRQDLVSKTKENIVFRREVTFKNPDVGNNLLYSYLHSNNKLGALLEVSFADSALGEETDVRELCEDIVMQVAAMNPLFLESSEVPDEVAQRQMEIYRAQLIESGKPEISHTKIIEGKMARWHKDIVLLDQPSVKVSNKTIGQLVKDLNDKYTSNIKLSRFVRYSVGE